MQRQLALSLTLVACFFGGLGSGTMYIYSAYSPQLAARLNLTATAASSLGMIGNLGVALTAPMAGSAVDRHGPSRPLIVGAVGIFLGYYLVKACYQSGVSHFAVLSAALLLIGGGSSFAFASVVNCAARNFTHARGFATSVPMAAIGLCAFVFSTLATTLGLSDTADFLGLLVFLPAALFVVTWPLIKIHPTAGGDEKREVDEKHDEFVKDLGHKRSSSSQGSSATNLTGHRLLSNRLFLVHFLIMGLISGIGQMYIYSCGYVVKALASQDGDASVQSMQAVQAFQVGAISLGSFAGRLASGSLSDWLHIRHKLRRTWLLLATAILTVLAQVAGLLVCRVSDLWLVSFLTGIAYGTLYGAYPTIIGDSFGMQNFSQNWGFLSIAPLAFSYFFNNMFGRIYDASLTMGVQGNGVFHQAFRATLTAACLVTLLTASILA